MTASPVLQLEEVRKVRPGLDGKPVGILGGIDLELYPGEVLAVVGPSGGGKSTLARLLNRLEDPDGGSIRYHGRNLQSFDPIELRRKIALVPQKPFMFPGSVRENLQAPGHYRGPADPSLAEDFSAVLDRVGLDPELLERDARSLSIGQQQRVGLARALTLGPEVLVLDEPTSALDRPGADRLARTLRSLCREKELSLLLVTHDLRLAERVADRAAFLEGGQIHDVAPAAEFFSRPASPGLQRFLAEPDAAGDST